MIDEYLMNASKRIVSIARVVYEVEKESPHYKNMVEFLEPQN